MDIGRSCHITFSIDPPRRGNRQSAIIARSSKAHGLIYPGLHADSIGRGSTPFLPHFQSHRRREQKVLDSIPSFPPHETSSVSPQCPSGPATASPSCRVQCPPPIASLLPGSRSSLVNRIAGRGNWQPSRENRSPSAPPRPVHV